MAASGNPRHGRLKELLTIGRPVAGLISPLASPALVQLAATAGFRTFIADGEHGNLEPKDLEPLVAVAEVNGIDLIVRTPGLDRSYIARSLDAGVAGIIVPHGSPETARAAVEAARFPPGGARGVGPAYGNRFGLDLDAEAGMASADLSTTVIVQVEDVEAVRAATEIAATPGIDGLLIGPRDLAYSLNAYDDQDPGALESAIDTTIAAAREAGKWAALPATSEDAARAAARRGAQLILAYLPQLIATAGADFVGSAIP